MAAFKRVMDFVALGSDRPLRRLVAYYAVLAIATATLTYAFPALSRLLLGDGVAAVDQAASLLRDGLGSVTPSAPGFGSDSLLMLGLATLLALIGTLALMLPVTWVYMSARRIPGHNQSVAQALLILPIVIAGVVFIVRDSLALAFSLAGVVAAVRFRTTLRDARDSVFIFLAIGVGFAAGVQTLAVGALVSVVFNFVLLLTWRYDFGRNVLEPTAASQWAEPLASLATRNGNGVPDRDLVLALTPRKVEALAERFDRVRDVIGPKKKKPRYNAVLSLTSDRVGEAQAIVERTLDRMVKRWVLDEVVPHTGKPSEIYYLVRVGKSTTREEIITAIRSRAGDRVAGVDVEIGDAERPSKQETS